MQLLIPITVNVENVDTPNATLTPEQIASVQEAVKNALAAAQGDGFAHEKSEELSILVEEVDSPIPMDLDGPFEKAHELDTLPTYVHDTTEDEDSDDKRAVIFGEGIPWETRFALSSLICPVLNAAMKTSTTPQPTA